MNIFPFKACRVCGLVQPLTKFYAHRDGGDGTLNKCMMCCREQMQERLDRPGERERRRAYKRLYDLLYPRRAT
jgi:hypothetical protein